MTVGTITRSGTNDGSCRASTTRVGEYEAIVLKRAISDTEMIQNDIEFRVNDQGAHPQPMHFASRSNGLGEDPPHP